MTWHEYGRNLEERLDDLHGRIHRGAYWAQPSKQAWIPKADERQRPLGIAALAGKIVQQAVKTVLEQIYEEDFLGFSYGFRPGRSCHNALDALWVGIAHRKVNWVLDADIRGFLITSRNPSSWQRWPRKCPTGTFSPCSNDFSLRESCKTRSSSRPRSAHRKAE
jgi:hypothetical protein